MDRKADAKVFARSKLARALGKVSGALFAAQGGWVSGGAGVKDYSQYGEQAAILAAVSHIQGGRFLDIGAYHPSDKSNTRALYECGWSGMMIEPSPGPMRALLREYGNDTRITLIQAAIGAEGFQEMHITDDAVSTTDPSVRAIWAEQGGYYGKMLAWHVRITDILDHFGPFDFINIDAEGNSGSIFVAALAFASPACWCVEHDGEGDALAAEAGRHGYRVALLNGCNLVVAK